VQLYKHSPTSRRALASRSCSLLVGRRAGCEQLPMRVNSMENYRLPNSPSVRVMERVMDKIGLPPVIELPAHKSMLCAQHRDPAELIAG